MFLFLRGSLFSLPENNSIRARILRIVAGAGPSYNSIEELAPWDF